MLTQQHWKTVFQTLSRSGVKPWPLGLQSSAGTYRWGGLSMEPLQHVKEGHIYSNSLIAFLYGMLSPWSLMQEASWAHFGQLLYSVYYFNNYYNNWTCSWIVFASLTIQSQECKVLLYFHKTFTLGCGPFFRSSFIPSFSCNKFG